MVANKRPDRLILSGDRNLWMLATPETPYARSQLFKSTAVYLTSKPSERLKSIARSYAEILLF